VAGEDEQVGGRAFTPAVKSESRASTGSRAKSRGDGHVDPV